MEDSHRTINTRPPTQLRRVEPGNSAKRIRDVREMLGKRNGAYAALTPVAKAKWTKALLHNWHDCVGLRALMIECAGD